ncbi:MAG: hypothetical protein QNL51_07565 [Opitutaceae bacterium]|tara:strand:+ start:4549 stop:4695 length:147 start_codon:yes stop_codon:yes gene_type:complete
MVGLNSWWIESAEPLAGLGYLMECMEGSAELEQVIAKEFSVRVEMRVS